MSLVEVLVAMTILSIGVLGFVGSFSYISKAIRVSRAGTLATNLAQEKIENLKNEPYYKLALTTVTTASPNFFPVIYYDNLNYGLETIRIGGITFERGVLVSMAQVADGSITSVGYNYPDTGMKMLTVYVMWQQGTNWKYVSLENVYENPVVDPLTAQVSGTVKDGGGTGIAGALVRIVENADWSDTTGAGGTYGFSAQPGTYALRASSVGYYDTLVTEVSLSSTNIETLNFTLTEIATGTITGRAWSNPNLLIAGFALSTTTIIADGATLEVEFIQLFNPTTYAINIGNDVDGSSTKIKYWRETTGSGSDNGDMLVGGGYDNYVASYVPAGRYYLIANTSFFWLNDRYIHADGHYPGKKMKLTDGGSIELLRVADDYTWDVVGWRDLAGTQQKWEGTQISNPTSSGGKPAQCSLDGMGAGWSYMRISSPASVNDGYAPAYDSGDNEADFLSTAEACQVVSPMPLFGVRNTSDAAPTIIAGVPMFDAYVTADDLMGPATNALRTPVSEGILGTTVTLTSEVAYFSLAGVSTGTWNVVIASGAYSATISEVEIVQNVSTGIPNGVTEPSWALENYAEVNLTTQSVNGYVAGTIRDISGAPISGIKILAGGESKTTGVNGRYFVSVGTGSLYLTANPNNLDTRFVESVENAVVETGELTTVNFTLTEGGVISGFVSSDGTSILPNVQVAATKSGAQYGLATSDDSGNERADDRPKDAEKKRDGRKCRHARF